MTVGRAEQVEQTAVQQQEQETLEVSPAELEQQKIEGLLDAGAGRMSGERQTEKNQEPKAEKPAEPDASSEAEAEAGEVSPDKKDEEPIEPPAHWPEERREEFAKLPPPAQRILSERHKEMERGYNEKYQKLANERMQLQAWDQLVKRVQTDPQFANHVFSYGQQAQQPAQPEVPEDPIEALKYEAARQAREQILGELAPSQERLQQMERQFMLQQTLAQYQRDPLYGEVDAAMREYVNGQPTETMKRELYQRLDSDPQAYGETYAALRKTVEAGKRQPEAAQPAAAKKERKVTPRQAPQLETAGAQAAGDTGKRSAKLAALTKKIKSNRAGTDDIGDYLEMSGALDRF